MRSGKLGPLAAVAIALVAGCANNAPGDLTTSAAKVLRPAVENVRQVAHSGTYADLKTAVQQLTDLVRQQERDGAVTAQRANAIEDAANVLLQDAKSTMTTSPTPTTTSASPAPTVTSESPTPTPTSASPTPTETSASPTPTSTQSPVVSVSAGTRSTHHQRTPSSRPSASPSPSSSP